MQKNKLITSITSVIIFLFCTSIAYAKPHLVEVRLVSLIVKQTVDPDGDRVYFEITAYPSEILPNESRMPAFPLHWLSSELSTLHNVKLWQGTIDDKQSTTVVFALMNQRIPLLENDNLIGTIQVELTNKNNTINSIWCQPNYVDQTLVDQLDPKAPKFIMYGDDGQYRVEFKVVVIN